MSKQTAVALLFDYIEANIHEDNFNILAAKEQALRMEKEQILDSWDDGYSCGMYQEGLGIDYYNETFGGDNE